MGLALMDWKFRGLVFLPLFKSSCFVVCVLVKWFYVWLMENLRTRGFGF